MADFTTVQVSELPPLAPTIESFLAHQIGDVLYKMTLPELLTLISIQASARKYEIKQVRAPNAAYISENFDMTIGATQGIGKPTGLWAGWAICNGNNGTDNLDGQALIGYGANYATVGQFLGEKNTTLIESQLPVINKSVTLPTSGADNGGGSGVYLIATDLESTGNKVYSNALSFGGGLSHNNMQPSMVILTIMKI